MLRKPDRHPVLHPPPSCRFGSAAFQFHREPFENVRAFLRIPARPAIRVVERRPGCCDSRVDIGFGAPGDRTDPLLGGRGMDADGVMASWRGPRTADVELGIIDW